MSDVLFSEKGIAILPHKMGAELKEVSALDDFGKNVLGFGVDEYNESIGSNETPSDLPWSSTEMINKYRRLILDRLMSVPPKSTLYGTRGQALMRSRQLYNEGEVGQPSGF